jgi:hypothetical protein
MDGHHEIVAKARAAAGTGTRLYFGYSTVLDRQAFDDWKREHGYDLELPTGELAEGVDLALVYDFPSRWWGGRVAGLADAAGSSVYGRLFEIAERDWPIVAHKEGGVTGMSVERTVRVRVAGEIREATAFTTNPKRASKDGPISTRFVEALVRGAKSAQLPDDYVAKLAQSSV